jgi:hypothetical protein
MPAEAKVVTRIYADYIKGMSQRAVVRALNEAGVPTRHGGPWQQSAITRILSSPTYTGRLVYKGETMPASHDAIISPEVWQQAKTIRTGGHSRKAGRHPDGQHLLVKGTLVCGQCGSAMIPRKARPGVERARYVCRGRIEHGRQFCDQPSIRREAVDEPFLAKLLDSYLDLEATRCRIAERTADDLRLAHEAVTEREAEVGRIEVPWPSPNATTTPGTSPASSTAPVRPD